MPRSGGLSPSLLNGSSTIKLALVFRALLTVFELEDWVLFDMRVMDMRGGAGPAGTTLAPLWEFGWMVDVILDEEGWEEDEGSFGWDDEDEVMGLVPMTGMERAVVNVGWICDALSGVFSPFWGFGAPLEAGWAIWNWWEAAS
jgi:hypothetical protein